MVKRTHNQVLMLCKPRICYLKDVYFFGLRKPLTVRGATTVPILAYSLRLIIPRGLCVSGHLVRPFVSNTSPKCIHREGLGRRRTGTKKH